MKTVEKSHILNEIKRTTKENGGAPLGRARFETEVGIKYSDWYGINWGRWGDALREAGFPSNKLQGAYEEKDLIEKLITLTKEIGRFPVEGELRMKRRKDPTFPSHGAFACLGSKHQLKARVIEYCRSHPGLEDVADICAKETSAPEPDRNERSRDDEPLGYVYLLRSGRNYKIGKTDSFGRRERELSIQLPEKPGTVHVIKTDDPGGIERYWHERFAAKRKYGEWFELDPSDLKAFKRRRFM